MTGLQIWQSFKILRYLGSYYFHYKSMQVLLIIISMIIMVVLSFKLSHLLTPSFIRSRINYAFSFKFIRIIIIIILVMVLVIIMVMIFDFIVITLVHLLQWWWSFYLHSYSCIHSSSMHDGNFHHIEFLHDDDVDVNVYDNDD